MQRQGVPLNQKIITIKTFECKKLLLKSPQNTRSGIKCCYHWEKRKTSQLQVGFSDKVNPDIDFIDEPVIQCDVPVIKILLLTMVIYKWL